MSKIDQYIDLARRDKGLSEAEMAEAMTEIMEGRADEEQIAAFLTILVRRGETVDEITGAARVLRRKASTITAPEDALDCCGTGGDGIGTYNISTAVAFVCAACGVPMAKHGNRSASSKSGAADVLEALGINLDVGKEALEDALRRFNFCFLMAPHHHAAMKHVVPVRKALGFRTIFNLLGPLANPANTRLQLIGIFDEKWQEPMAQTLKRLGSRRAWIVHGADGMDEITITGSTRIVKLDNGAIREETVTPADFSLPECEAGALQGGDAAENAAALRALLEGAQGAYRDIVLANSAAVLNIHGSAASLRQGVAMAAQAVDSRQALNLLHSYRDYTQDQVK